ncbi:hypothetical protein [Acetivibrio mesophilus]|jgi:hypothetical protein|uniref:Uncharacterized protein n=1 Tax=Acetivibrio mesophilus TaxID=2487273 RepID=A0A4Q0I189_9FIRM|nr:hypothetical protein [Acetivibrio mesophilus]ODM27111.1 hypothetical protein A7W90_13305 [Clostridium sp. Bc-iso-3]RXE58010.1 hypothetical protein EFD62_14615 [Acetivibrio mesophilus]HHV30649.1 hypothetical protein [Clostridium sp.]
MVKKISVLLLIVIFSMSTFMTVFANEKIDLISDKKTEDTKQFLVTITRPEGDETTFKESYVICGNSDKQDITVKLLMYNEETEEFEPFMNLDGEDTWVIGASGFFMKEIELPKKGANRIRIAAYQGSEKMDKAELVLGENLQVNTFTVTLLDKSIRNSIKNGFLRITDMLDNLFGA